MRPPKGDWFHVKHGPRDLRVHGAANLATSLGSREKSVERASRSVQLLAYTYTLAPTPP